jgi:pyruvate dehydrogenase E2 component (dihydrolipoamide acetyltransferase)
MSEELTMPRLSDTMEQGTIGRWLKREGESFHEGDVIAEIETDKATMDFQAYEDGTMLKILVADGESAALGAPIAIVGAEGEEVPEADSAAPAEAAVESPVEAPANGGGGDAPTMVVPPRAAEPQAAGNGGDGAFRASPIARRMADAAGLDLRTLAGSGTGPDGRIVKADVERALESGAAPVAVAPAPVTPAAAAPAPAPVQAAPPAPGEDEVRELTPMLKAVAKRMAEAKATVPHFYVSSEIDMTRALELRAELNAALADAGEKVSVNDLIVRACAQALMQHPQAHRSYVDGHHVYHAHVHAGIAVALDDGLIVPVLRDADTKGLRQIARPGRTRTRGQAAPGRDRGRHVHGLQPGHVRRGVVLGHHQPARVDYPGRLVHRGARRRAGRGGRRPPDHARDALVRPPGVLRRRRSASAADRQAAPGSPHPPARMTRGGHVHSV